jgi:hypothetical protein
LGELDLKDLIKSLARSGARVERLEWCVVEHFFTADIAKLQISRLASLLDDRSTLVMPVGTVDAECAMRTLKGGK